MLLHALTLAGLRCLRHCVLMPVATGMSLALCLLSLPRTAPAEQRFVLFSRIDQKAALKSITTAGLTPLVVPLRRDGDECSVSLIILCGDS